MSTCLDAARSAASRNAHVSGVEVFSCREFLARHSEYLDGTLTVEEADRMRSHQKQCAGCARYDRVLRRGVELLLREQAAEPDADFLHGLHTRLAREEERAAMRPISMAATATLSIAAVLVLVSWMPALFSAHKAGTGSSQAGVGTVSASEIAWHAGWAVEPLEPHTAFPAPDISLTSNNADIEVIDHGYSPLILEAPTAPPTYVNASLTTFDTR